jgi:hypothetical protein
MANRRRRRGFERAGHLPLNQSGLPATRARTLRMVHAWQQVAGEVIARNVPAVSLRRGALELAPQDAIWHRTLIPMVEDLGLRLARQFPELGLRRIVVATPELDTFTMVLPQKYLEETPPPASKEDVQSNRPARPTTAEAPAEAIDLDAKLREVRQRYLERASKPPGAVKSRSES